MRTALMKNFKPRGLDRAGLRRIYQLLDSQLKELEKGRDLQGQLLLNVENSRKEIRAAIRRIGFGVYGICDTCAEDISLGQLENDPTARQCTGCRAELEGALKLQKIQDTGTSDLSLPA